jgi:hypothetical protein
LVLALLAAGIGCTEDESELWQQGFDIQGPYTGSTGFAYVDGKNEEVIMVSPSNADGLSIDVRRTPTGDSPGASYVSHDSNALYTLNDESETLTITSFAEADSQEIELGAAFDRLVVDPEGEFLITYFSGVANNQIIARNLNAVAIIDLRATPNTVTPLTLSSRPEGILFAPKFTVEAGGQRLAAVLSRSEVTVLDLLADNPEDQLREVPLTISEADLERLPQQVLFDVTPSEQNPDVVSLYVRTTQSRDITQIEIAPGTGSARKFAVSVNQLAAGNSPGTMALVELPGKGTRLLVSDSAQARFTVIDVATSASATFDLPMGAPASQIVPYVTTVESDEGDVPEVRALAWNPSSSIVTIIRPEFIPLEGDQPALGRSVEPLRLSLAPSRIEFSEGDSDRAIAFHSGVTSGFSILDLNKNNDIPIQGGSLNDLWFDGQNAFVIYTGLAALSVVGPEGNPLNFEMPERAQKIFVSENGILVQHNRQEGIFSVLDTVEPTPENQRYYSHVFLQDILQWELGQ